MRFKITFLFAVLVATSFAQTATWIAQDGGTTSLNAVSFVNFQTAFAVGENGTAIRTNDAGSNWENMTSGTSEHLNDVCFINTQVGWFVGDNNTVKMTTNSGDDWTNVSIPITDDIFSVFFIDENNGWLGLDSKDTILYTTNQGASWSKTKIIGNGVKGIYFVDNTKGWFINEIGIFNTTDGGVSWTQQYNLGASYVGTSINFVDDNNGWASGSNGRIWHTSNGGSSWEIQDAGLTMEVVNSISFSDVNNGICVASNSKFYKTSDGGTTWEEDFSAVTPAFPFLDVEMINENTIYMVGINGLIFRKQASQEICIVLVDSLTGKNKIIWDKIYDQSTASYKLYKLMGSNFVFLAEQNFNDLTEYIDLSSNPTQVSAQYKISTVDSLSNESEKSPYHQTIYLSISEGVPNTHANLSWTFYEDESGVFIPDYYYIYRGTQPDNIALYDSVSAAFQDFTDEDAQAQHYYFVSVEKPNACVSESSAKTTGGPYSQSISNIDDYESPSAIEETNTSIEKISVYPNPAHNQLTISNEQLVIESIEITDITGKKLLNVIASEAKQSFNIDIANLENGVYLIKIKTTEARFVKRFVKE